MNNYQSKYLLFSGLLSLLLLATSPLQAQTETGLGKGDVTRGASEWATNCVRCHEMREPSEFDDALWKPVLMHMRLEGGLTGKQTRDILAFIQSSDYHPPEQVAMAAPAPSGTHGNGQSIYGTTCIACHGANGKGAVAGTPDFTSASGPLSKSDSVLLDHIMNGFKTAGAQLAMPPRGGNPSLSDDDLKTVLAFIRQKFGH